MRDLKTVFCHLHSHSQPRYPHFALCPYCREDAPHETIVVEAVVNYFSSKLRDFFIQTELEVQMGTTKRRADIVIVDGERNYAAIVECKRIGVRDDGIEQLNSYLCATDTPLGVFANSTVPNDWEFYENLGRNQFKDIRSDAFWKNIQGILEEENLQPSKYYSRGLTKYNSGIFATTDGEYDVAIEQYTAAIADLDKVIQLKPDNTTAHQFRANAYYNRGKVMDEVRQYAGAIADYDKFIQINPDYTEAYFKRGLVKAKLKQYDDAIADFDNAIRLKPNYVEAYYHRGLTKTLLGIPAAAVADFDNAIQLKPDFAQAYYYQGFTRMVKLEQYDDAIADFDNAIQLKPDYAEAYYWRGNAKVKLKQYAAAIADFDSIIQFKPNDAEAYYRRGNAKKLLGQQDAAIADFDNAIRLKPDYAEVYYRRGKLRELMELEKIVRGGQYSIAIIADYDNAIRLKLDDAGVYHARGNARKSLGQYTDAIADYDIAIQLKPNYASLYHARANAKVKLEQYAAAIQDYDHAIRLEQDDLSLSMYYRHRGNVKELMGKSFAAMIDFHRSYRALKE